MYQSFNKVSTFADVDTVSQQLESYDIPFSSTYGMFEWAAAQYADKEALRFQPFSNHNEGVVSFSYRDVFEKITQTANLFNKLTVGEESSIVSYILPNIPQTHFTIWGAEAAGIVNGINPFLESKKISNIIRSANSKVLVCLSKNDSPELWEKTKSIIELTPSIHTLVIVGNDCDTLGLSAEVGIKVVDFNKSTACESSASLENKRDIHQDDIASYFHTGGTTGTPKIVQHTHANELNNAMSLNAFYPGSNDDVCLVGLPLFHVNAVIGTGLAAFMRGSCVLLLTPAGFRTPGVLENLWQLIEVHKATLFSCVPTILTALLNFPVDKHNIQSLNYVVCGAAPLSTNLMARFEDASGAKILESYGLTEGSCITTLNPPHGERKVGSIGLALPGQKLKIVQLSNDSKILKECSSNEVGTLLIQGKNVFPGYLQSEKNNGVLLDYGWLNTGDLAKIDEDGYVWLMGREKDLIIRGGHNIDPAMIEEVFMVHSDVASVAAVGQPDIYAGELPCVYICLKPGVYISTDELMSFCESLIPERAAKPVHIEIIDDLPLTEVGKIFKPALRLEASKRVISQYFDKKKIDCDVSVEYQIGNSPCLLLKTTVDTNVIKDAMSYFSIEYIIKESAASS